MNGILSLPDAPVEQRDKSVRAWEEPVTIRTYLPGAPDVNPLFLEKRVYQGSSGRVYPLPVIDHIATDPVEHNWKAVHIENEYLRLMILPEIGGRIHIGLDKTNGYDFIYRQNVIKPALVGLAGPWISGGIEFNWPQHHRPHTFMPVDVEIEHHADGSVTVWCSDIDRMSGMKGMHGVCLHPGKAYLELKARLYNRTAITQTFLWWANVATRVHEHYQSFFPTDVHYVADHAKRAISKYPLCDGRYYGVDYGERARSGVPDEEKPRMFRPDGSYPANDLGWYANIPVPTSYMILGTEEDFFGGYDHAAKAGLVHFANHHVAPGKKQWTWGNHEFGYLWDRHLTDNDGPYIELMAGVYTDNQPDFTFIAPGETKTFSQYWYPLREIGPPVKANLDAALSVKKISGGLCIGLCVTSNQSDVEIEIAASRKMLFSVTASLTVDHTYFIEQTLPADAGAEDVSVVVKFNKREVLRYEPGRNSGSGSAEPLPAAEPQLPAEIATNEELYLIGLHLEQYRHATRRPEDYWREALRRDANDLRANLAMGKWHLQRGEFRLAEIHLQRAIARQTYLNPNPQDSETYYALGLCHRYMGRLDSAYKNFYKATWNAAWRGPAYHALAEIDASNENWALAVEHAQASLRTNIDNLNLRNLLTIALQRTGRAAEANHILEETRRLDLLDSWSRFIHDGDVPQDGYKRQQLAFDLIRSGLLEDAIVVLSSPLTQSQDGSEVISLYSLANCYLRLGNLQKAREYRGRASEASPDYCFPNTLDEMLILEEAASEGDGLACYYLGNFLYDRRRHEDAILEWERATELGVGIATLWRNLGVAYFNTHGDAKKSRAAYDRAFLANPSDARILYERDQLWKRVGVSPEIRLKELLKHPDLTRHRNDLSVELATLYNQTGRAEQALELLLSRPFQAWEGGEGLVLEQYIRANLMLGQQALASGDTEASIRYFRAALETPENLGEARHLLVNQSEIYYWLGTALHAADEKAEALQWWERAARQTVDFQQMSILAVSTASLWTALALWMLGRHADSENLIHMILQHSTELQITPPKIDYFATSLPTMLLFEEDIHRRNTINATFLEAQAHFGTRNYAEAKRLLQAVLSMDINHMGAINLSRLVQDASAARRVR